MISSPIGPVKSFCNSAKRDVVSSLIETTVSSTTLDDFLIKLTALNTEDSLLVEKAAMIKILNNFKRKAMCLSSN